MPMEMVGEKRWVWWWYLEASEKEVVWAARWRKREWNAASHVLPRRVVVVPLAVRLSWHGAC